MPKKKDGLDIRNLIAIVVVADVRNFKLAAEHLNTTQPTLSRLIKRLEDALDVTIFRRGWSGAETTPEGDIVCQYAREIRKVLITAEEKIYRTHEIHPKFETGLSISQLEVIDAVRRTGGATAAARDLGRSQPSISRTLNYFQYYFGLTLFERKNRGLVPLPIAVDVSDLFGKVDNILRNLCEQMKLEQGQIAGRIAIGVLPFSEQNLIPRMFAHISEKHPRARLVFVPGTYPGLVRALRRGEIEGIVGISRKEESPPDLIEMPLLEESFTIVARADHPIHKSAKTIEDLKNEKWLVPPFGSPVRAYFEKVFGELGVIPRVQTCEIQFFTAVEQMLADSNAIGMQTYSASGIRNLRPDLKKIDIPLPVEPATIGLTTLRGMSEEPVFAEFKKLFSEFTREFK